MTNAKWMLPVMLLLSGLMAAQSLTSSKVVAKVPFEFMVNNKIMPSGDYEVKTSDVNGQILAIGNFDARKGTLAQSHRFETGVASGETALVFERYGDTYFLSSIRIEGSDWTYELPESKAEVELRSQNMSGSKTSLLAALR